MTRATANPGPFPFLFTDTDSTSFSREMSNGATRTATPFENRSIVGCNVIIPRGVCGRVSNLGMADAACVCVCLCIECNKVYNTRSDKPYVRRTDRTSTYPRALFKIADD